MPVEAPCEPVCQTVCQTVCQPIPQATEEVRVERIVRRKLPGEQLGGSINSISKAPQIAALEPIMPASSGMQTSVQRIVRPLSQSATVQP